MDSGSIANRLESRRASRMSTADGAPSAVPQVPGTPPASCQPLPIFTNPRTGLPLVPPRPAGEPGSLASSGRKRRAAELEEDDDEDKDDPAHAAALAEARRGKRVCRREGSSDPAPAAVAAVVRAPPPPQNLPVPAVKETKAPVVVVVAASEPPRPCRVLKKEKKETKKKRNLQLRDPVRSTLRRPLPKTTLLYHRFVCPSGGGDAAAPYAVEHLPAEDGAAIRGAEALFAFRRRCPEAVLPTPAELTAWLATHENEVRARRAAAVPGSRPRRRHPLSPPPRSRHEQVAATAAPSPPPPAAAAGGGAGPEALGFLRRAVRAGRRALARTAAHLPRRLAPAAPRRVLHRAPEDDVVAVIPAALSPVAIHADAPTAAPPLPTEPAAAATEPGPAPSRSVHRLPPPPLPNAPSLPGPSTASSPATLPIAPHPPRPRRERTPAAAVRPQGNGGRFYVPEFSDSESDG